MSYAVVFKDLSVLARTASTDPNYNRGYHYVIWDIPADKRNAFALVATENGVQAALAVRVNDVWRVDAVVAWDYEDELEGAVSIKATW